MRKFLLFLAGLVAAIILIANIGPMAILGVSLWLVYIIFKQFMQASSTFAKVCWVVLGLVILSIGISNFYAVIGIGAAFVLYLIWKHWKIETVVPTNHDGNDDPFINFEQQWGEINK